MICWIGWIYRRNDEAVDQPTTLELVDQVRGLEARLERLKASRTARLSAARADTDAAIRALAPTENSHDDHDDA
jgi:hypothetical protein